MHRLRSLSKVYIKICLQIGVMSCKGHSSVGQALSVVEEMTCSLTSYFIQLLGWVGMTWIKVHLR